MASVVSAAVVPASVGVFVVICFPESSVGPVVGVVTDTVPAVVSASDGRSVDVSSVVEPEPLDISVVTSLVGWVSVEVVNGLTSVES